MRHWTVGGGVVRSGGELLLVQNRRRGGALDWSTPGGVIDAGEPLLEWLAAEVDPGGPPATYRYQVDHEGDGLRVDRRG